MTDRGVTIVFHCATEAISHERKNPKAIPSSPPPIEINVGGSRRQGA